jgi:hypothetical protein
VKTTDDRPPDKRMGNARYNPIKLRGPGPSASEIVLRDRDRFFFAERQYEAVREAKPEQPPDKKIKPK